MHERRLIFGSNRTVLVMIGIILVFWYRCELAYAGPDTHTPRIIKNQGEYVLSLPKSLEGFIQENFPTLRIPTDKDFVGDWASSIEKGYFPYISWGDFNGDRLIDIAMILIGRDHWKFIVFQYTKNDNYDSIILSESTKDPKRHVYPQTYGVSTLRVGEKKVHHSGNKTIELSFKNDAIDFFMFEGGAVIYYMEQGGEYKQVRYSD
jgi:hypothetical protein